MNTEKISDLRYHSPPPLHASIKKTPGSSGSKRLFSEQEETPMTKTARELGKKLHVEDFESPVFPDSSTSITSLSSVPHSSSKLLSKPLNERASILTLSPPKSSNEEEIQHYLHLLANFKNLDSSQTTLLMQDLSLLIFRHRKNNKEESPNELYDPETLLDISEFLFYQSQGLTKESDIRYFNRNANEIFNIALASMTTNQKEKLFHLLTLSSISSDPCYKLLSSRCFKKYFLEVDPRKGFELTSLPPYDEVLEHVIKRAKQDLTNREISLKVEALAKRLLGLFRIRKFPADYFFHFSQEASNIPELIENGVKVCHKKAKKGAFVSSNVEPSFGSYGVAISTHALAARQMNLDDIQRRPAQDSGSIWIGSSEKLPVIKEIILHPDDLSEEATAELKTNFPGSLLIPIEIQRKFLEYARELRWATPVPLNTHPHKLILSQRDAEV